MTDEELVARLRAGAWAGGDQEVRDAVDAWYRRDPPRSAAVGEAIIDLFPDADSLDTFIEAVKRSSQNH